MFVCICNAVSDRDIRAHAESGVSTLDELRLRTGCSDCCGQCADEAEEILQATLAARLTGGSTGHPTQDLPSAPRESEPKRPVLPVMSPQPA
ncbi:(2Fe-2S)-binding protein [Halomonas denitrificans]|nr:(2Fe-2S)-binding protein [Halomonas denitrificans]